MADGLPLHAARGAPSLTPRQSLLDRVGHFDHDLRNEFGEHLFAPGWCILLGRYYGQSPTVYFSLNPSIPRSANPVDPTSWGEWNVPFLNPPELKREYIYLQNCQRFFESDPALNTWIHSQITSAFLVPWRTRNLSDLTRLNLQTGGKLFSYSRAIAQTIIADHSATLVVAVGKAALGLMTRMQLIQNPVRETPVLGPGGSYQWSRWRASVNGTPLTILQIPHFSRANSPAKLQGLADWLQDQRRVEHPILAMED